MTDWKSYTFTVLRYVHDIATGEFINAGVLLYCKEERFLRARMRTTHGRLTRAFPDADGDTIKRTIAQLEGLITIASENLADLFPEGGNSVMDFAKRALPLDDSSLQWSQAGSGRSPDLALEVEHLFERFVLRYDRASTKARRTDDDVWKSFSRALERRNVQVHFRDKVIATDADRMTFKRAWRNGIWHCLEPISFDFTEGERIHKKALRWVGQMTALSGSNERFKLYMLVGEPKTPDVQQYYAQALKILDRMPVDKVVYTESQADELSKHIEKELQLHFQTTQTPGPAKTDSA